MPNGQRATGGRRGITLLEVLISIGVLSLGVMGVATLLPVATFYSNDATKYDRASTIAQQGYHDLLIRDFLNAKKWVDPAGAFTYHNNTAVVVDPLGLGYAWIQQPLPTNMPVYFPAFFPTTAGVYAPPANCPVLYRASVESGNSWPDSAPLPTTANPPLLLPYKMADRIFRSNDDLVFNMPTDTDIRPSLVGNLLSPDYEGEYSWMFTASHLPQDIANTLNMHRYEMTLVVLRNRDLTLWASGLDAQTPPPERLVYADFLQTPMTNVPFYAGGSLNLWLQEPTGGVTTPDQPNRHWLENIKPNTYLMLMANFVDGAAIAKGAPYPRLAWYRIVNADREPTLVSTSPNTWSSKVTVTGGDWSPMMYNGATLWTTVNPTNAAIATVYCALINDAVATYQDVVTLDNSLLRD